MITTNTRNKVKKHLLALFFCLFFTNLFAQGTPGFDDNVVDNPPAVAINQYILVITLLALFYGLYKTKKNTIQ
jgi:hypothetical protein